MLRPTRSRLVTETDIVPALRRCNLIKTKSFSVYFVGIFAFASGEAAAGRLTREPSRWLRARRAFLRNVAGEWRGFNRDHRRAGRLLRNQAQFRPGPRPRRARRHRQPRAYAAPHMPIKSGKPGGISPMAGDSALQRLAL